MCNQTSLSTCKSLLKTHLHLNPYETLNKGLAVGMPELLFRVLILILSLFSHASPLKILFLPHRERGFFEQMLISYDMYKDLPAQWDPVVDLSF